MACITSLEEDTKTGEWRGVILRTGEVKTFRSIDDYRQYVKREEEKGNYCPNVDPTYNVRYRKGQNTTRTGFMEFRPRDPVTQAKYDAMSPTWEGVDSSIKAVEQGLYKLDSADMVQPHLRNLIPDGKKPTTLSTTSGPFPTLPEDALESPETLFRAVRQSCVIQ